MTDRTSPETETVEGLRRDIAAIIAVGVGGDISSDTIATDIMLYLDLRSAIARPRVAPCPGLEPCNCRKAVDDALDVAHEKMNKTNNLPGAAWDAFNLACEAAQSALASPNSSTLQTNREGE